MFVYLMFRADWLLAPAVTSQKFFGGPEACQEPHRWSEDEIPILSTPINSIEILRQKKMTIQIMVYERDKKRTINLGYVNVKLSGIQIVQQNDEDVQDQDGRPEWDFELMVPMDQNVIAHNKSIGKF